MTFCKLSSDRSTRQQAVTWPKYEGRSRVSGRKSALCGWTRDPSLINGANRDRTGDLLLAKRPIEGERPRRQGPVQPAV